MNCKRCGARLQQSMLICPECGARQRRQARAVRCAYCHRRASVDLAVCPHCGRNLKPAGPLWGVWLAGLALLVFAVLWGLGQLPIRQTWQRVVGIQQDLASLVQIPELPALDASQTPAAALVTSTAQATLAPTGTAIATTAPPPDSASAMSTPGASQPVSATVAPATTQPASATATAAPSATTVPPTATPAPSATPAPPTLTPVPPTATPGEVKYYTVQPGDTLIVIGNKTNFDWQEIATLNGLTAYSQLQVGQKLRLPGGASADNPAPTQAPAATRTYRVQAGDSFAAIASRFGLTWEEVARANNMNQYSMLQPGMELIIPGN